MDTTVYEIQKHFANLPEGKFKRIEQEDGFCYWVYKRIEGYGTAIEMEHPVEIDASFATARIYEIHQQLDDGREYIFLCLENNDAHLRNEFAGFCSQFIYLGKEGEQRKSIKEDPYRWWSQWRDLLGNAVRVKNVYSLIGELSVYEKLLAAGVNAFWGGPMKSSHDIETETIDYEVKSTMLRYGTEVTISSQHQLKVVEGKQLKLAFCRFEKVETGGESINSLVEKIAEHGIHREDIEEKLSKLGFRHGCIERKEQYKQLESFVFSVDDSFPKITENSFSESRFPERIEKISYTIQLSGLEYEIL